MSSRSARLSSINSAYHYNSIFGDICSTRFKKYAKFLLTTSWALGILTAMPSSLSWPTTLLPFRTIPMLSGFFLIACLRKNNLHVDFLGYRTLANQLVGQLINKKFIVTFFTYWISSISFFTTLSFQFDNLDFRAIPQHHSYPPLNDRFVFYYYFASFIALIYSLQHSVFDRDRLNLTYGSFHAHPKKSLLVRSPMILFNSLTLTLITLLGAPLTYLYVRYYVYNVILISFGWLYGLNQTHPPFSVSLSFFFAIIVMAFILFLYWELVNAAFTAYLSVGCLYRDHTISELSKDPFGTLLTGLQTEKPFTKMTAFQELAYLSNTKDIEKREIIYNRNEKREFVWGDILLECEKVIKANNSNISLALAVPSSQTENIYTKKYAEKWNSENLFGHDYRESQPADDEDLPIPKQPHSFDQEPEFFNKEFLGLIFLRSKQALQSIKTYYHNFVESDFGIPFRKTLRREAERLCPNPVTVGNAIIAISLFATHAYDEDKKGSVSSTITEILDILEKSVSTCGRFVQNPPVDLEDRDQENVISLLHELSMNAFFEVTVKYSDVLNDIVLPPDVLYLVNWTLETTLKEEEEEEL